MAVVADPTDLATYLGADSIDIGRATLVIELAQSVAEAVASPLTVGARAVVLACAARAYTNPQQIPDETIGPFRRSGMQAGVFLTRDERKTLKLLAGRGGAFTVNPMAPIDLSSSP